MDVYINRCPSSDIASLDKSLFPPWGTQHNGFSLLDFSTVRLAIPMPQRGSVRATGSGLDDQCVTLHVLHDEAVVDFLEERSYALSAGSTNGFVWRM